MTSIVFAATASLQLWSYKANPVQPLTPPAIERLSEIKCPTLVIVGDQDMAHIKETAQILATGIAGAKLVTIPRAGHLVNLDSSVGFNDAIDTFLRQ
jgi:pimeloyl-ACP methyl ester carboxylesterase